MTFAYLSGIDLAVVVVFALIVAGVLFTGRKLHFDIKGVHATVDQRGDEAVEAAKAAKVAASTVNESIGTKNGNGDLMTMVARALAELAEMRGQTQEILRWQDDHSAEDEHRRVDMLNRITELATYTHDGVHELRNLMTPVKAKVDLMWPHRQAETEEET